MELEKFLADLSSDMPAPGGGAAAALSGAMAAALVSMVANLTKGRERYAAYQELAEKSASRAEYLMFALRECMNKDMRAYDGVMTALKLPKSTDEEKLTRSEKLQEAYKDAISAPFETVNNCLEVMKLARNLIGKSNLNVESDLISSLVQAKAGIDIALEIVKINLAFIKNDEKYSEKISLWLSRSKRESKELIQWQQS